MLRYLIPPLLTAALTIIGCYAPSQATSGGGTLPAPLAPRWTKADLDGPQRPQHAGPVLGFTEIESTPSLGPAFVTVGADGEVLRWNATTGVAHRVFQLPSTPRVAALGEAAALVAWYDGESVSVTCAVGCSKTWRLTTLKIRVLHLAFQGRDEALLIGGADGRVYRWAFVQSELVSGVHEKERTLERYVGHQTVVSAVASHPFQRAFFSTDWDGALYGWLPYSADDHKGAYDRNLFTGRAYTDATSFVRALRTPDRGITALNVSRDGNRLALGTDDGFVEIWEVRGLTLAARKQVHTGRVVSVALDPSNERVVSSGRDSNVSVDMLRRDPDYGIKTTAQPYLLAPISSQRLENVDHVHFLANSRIIATTKEGVIAELSGPSTPSVEPGSAPTSDTQSPNREIPTTTDADSDY